MRAFLSLLAKDLRLLWRDRVGLTFLGLAPLAVITVAGLSLANLYGADPTGQTAYELPLADEDGGTLGRDIHDRLARETRGTTPVGRQRAQKRSGWYATSRRGRRSSSRRARRRRSTPAARPRSCSTPTRSSTSSA